MKLKNIIKYLLLISILSIFSTNSFSENRKCDSDLITYIFKEGNKNFNYNETRNDAGVFFDFKWDKLTNKIIIKRNQNNFPIVRYSLFDNKNFIADKTFIKKINSKNLSNLNDEDLNKLTSIPGKVNFELGNGKNITISSQSYKLNNFKLSDFKILSIHNIDTTKGILEMSFNARLTNKREDLKKLLQDTNLLDDALHNICDEVRDFLVWPLTSIEFDEFRYDADVREGLKNKEKLVNPVFQITYDNDLLRTLRTEKGIGFFRQSFDFTKFPFDTQKLIIRLKTGVGNFPTSNNEDNTNKGSLTFITPEKGVFVSLENFLDPENNKLKAWRIKKNGINVKSKILTRNTPDIYNNEIIERSENVLDIEIIIERNYQHYLFKVMLPVFFNSLYCLVCPLDTNREI